MTMTMMCCCAAGNETLNSTNTTGNATKPRPVPVFFNKSTFEFQIVPNTSVNLTLTSECSSLQLTKEIFSNLSQPMVATMDCSVLDPVTVEEGLTVVSRAVGLNFPQWEEVVYPVELNMELDLAPNYYTSRRRHLLQQSGPKIYKVCNAFG